MTSRREQIRAVIAETIWRYQSADKEFGDLKDALKDFDKAPQMCKLLAACCVDEAELICATLDRFGILSAEPNEIILHALENSKVKMPQRGPYDPDAFSPISLIALFREFVIRNAVVWRHGAGHAGHPLWSALAHILDGRIDYPDLDAPDVREFLSPANRRPLHIIKRG
jgi:hypothetical protein